MNHANPNPNPNPDLPVRVVVFASEQLFPALHFLLHAADRFGSALHSIHIYCTHDERRSGEPAARLQNALQRWGSQRQLGFDIHLTTGDNWPSEVRRGLSDWFNTFPDSHWLVNVTGGTKPMSAAAIELTLASDLPSRRVIYQEIDGIWVELMTNDDGLLGSRPLVAGADPAVPRPDTLDRLMTVEDLVSAQFSADHSISTQSLQPIAMDEAVQHLVSLNWQWQQALTLLRPPVPAISSGDAFERFIGAGLRDCGLSFTHSLKVTDEAVSKTVREVDLVGCHAGRLVCIDIKLPGAQDHLKGTQLADVAELSHSLGGRGALPIAVRPGWPEDQETMTLAKALGVRLLTQKQSPVMFSQILAWISPALRVSAAVQRAEQQLQAIQAQGNTVFSNGRTITATANDKGIVFLPAVMERVSASRGEPWVLVQLLGSHYFLAVLKKSEQAPPPSAWVALAPRLRLALERASDRNSLFSFNESNAWVYAQFALGLGIKPDRLLDTVRQLLQPGR